MTDAHDRSSNRMRNGNQPPDVDSNAENFSTDASGDQHRPVDDGTLDNTRDGPRDSDGITKGASTFTKIGGIESPPGAQLDPLSVSGERVPAPLLVLVVLVVVVVGAAVLAALV